MGDARLEPGAPSSWPPWRKLLVEGIGASSRRQVRRPLSPEELAALTKVRGAAHGFDGAPPGRREIRSPALAGFVRGWQPRSE